MFQAIYTIPTDEDLDEQLKEAEEQKESLERTICFLKQMKQLNGAGRLKMLLKLDELLCDQKHPDAVLDIKPGDVIRVTTKMEKYND